MLIWDSLGGRRNRDASGVQSKIVVALAAKALPRHRAGHAPQSNKQCEGRADQHDAHLQLRRELQKVEQRDGHAAAGAIAGLAPPNQVAERIFFIAQRVQDGPGGTNEKSDEDCGKCAQDLQAEMAAGGVDKFGLGGTFLWMRDKQSPAVRHSVENSESIVNALHAEQAGDREGTNDE